MIRGIYFLKIIGTSAIVGFVILLLTKNNHFSCSALDTFSSPSSFNLLVRAFELMVIACGIWLLGLILFLFIRKKKKLNIYLYFFFLTTISLSSLIINSINRDPEENRRLKEEICKKGKDNGMQLAFQQLTKEEYDFINSETNWLPTIPDQTENVNIDYYRDDFLGDFHLTIELKLKENETMDSLKFPKWTSGDGKYYYEDYQN